jgi:hypothetical protein
MRSLLLFVTLLVAGCAPEIGDACQTSVDCSQGGERQCDVAQEGGYCTVFDCEAGKCPEEAACVVFGASPSTVEDCSNESGTSPSLRSACMRICEEDADCRASQGYGCLSPSEVGAQSIDGDKRVCMIRPRASLPPKDGTGDVCSVEPPTDGAAGAGAD